MEDKQYFCPNCRSNRIKFSILRQTSQSILKDAATGQIVEQQEPVEVETAEPMITCNVCGFNGNEMRFIKQAEREPNAMTPTRPVYV